MKLTREHFRAIIFYNLRRGLSRQECIDNLNLYLAIKRNPIALSNAGSMNSMQVFHKQRQN